MADKPERRNTQGRPVAKPAGQPAARPAGAAKKPTGARPAPGGTPAARPASGGAKKPAGKPMPTAGPAGGVEPTMVVSKADAAAARKSGGKAAGKRPSGGKPARGEPSAGERDMKRSSGKRRRADEGGAEPAPRGGRRGGGGAGALRPDGMGLAPKFALAVSGTIFVLMLIFSFIVYQVSSNAIGQQIDDDGVIMVSLLAKLSEEYHVLQKVEEIRTGWKECLDKRAKGEDPPDDWRQKQTDYKQAMDILEQRYKRHLDELRYFQLKGQAAEVAAFPRVLAVSIFSRKADGSWQNVISSGEIGTFDPPQTIFTFNGERTDIRLGRGDMKGHPMVVFTKPAYDRFKGDGSALPWVAHVFLNAEEISRAKGRLMLNIILFLILTTGAGVGVAFFLATRVTAPVRELIHDIDEVSRGKLEHRTIARSSDEIGVLAKAFNAMTESLLVAREKEVENQQRAHELNIATEIQANLLPKKIPRMPGFDIDAFYQPSKEVGGDYYDFIPIDENHLGMIVADVSGKGIPGSMVMTMGRAIIRMEGMRNLSPADTFSKANRQIAQDIRRGMFITAIYAILDVPNRTLLVASAGHNPMVIWRKESNAIQLVNPNGIALGFDRGPIFERTIKEQMVKLNRGDRVVMYTDGIPESMNAKHEEFGDKRFYQLCQKVANRNSNQFTNIVVAKVKEHQGDSEQHDDITVLTLAVE